MTESIYLPAFASLWDLWTKWKDNDDIFVKALSLSGLEALKKKLDLWTTERLHVATFLDPVQRAKIQLTRCEFVRKNEVFLYI